jgi:hypothetical protein
VFRTVSDLPAAAPPDLRQRPVDAKAKLVKAYAAAVKDWTKAGDDKAAAEADKELGLIKAWKDISVTRRVWTADNWGFRLVGKGVWEETRPDGSTVRWMETDRTPEYVEIRAIFKNLKYVYRFTTTTVDTQIEPAMEFKLGAAGKWAE